MTIPKQKQWPAKYFLYGRIMEAKVLGKVLGRETEGVEGEMRRAIVKGGEIKMWGVREALVDAGRSEVVRGKMFVVESEEVEGKLRAGAGEGFQVCRCLIELGGGEEYCGLTFRFCGKDGSLMEQ